MFGIKCLYSTFMSIFSTIFKQEKSQQFLENVKTSLQYLSELYVLPPTPPPTLHHHHYALRVWQKSVSASALCTLPELQPDCTWVT